MKFKILTFLLFLNVSFGAWALDFKVESFKLLPNDISAFINPVRDLNDEDCALIKVIAPEDFAFSSPLGIVRREDKVGEIWIYLPRKSKKLTIKHPRYGVIRDYALPEKIESHQTYELRINIPQTQSSGNIADTKVVATLVDTLILTKTDTVLFEKPRERVPFRWAVMATYTVGGNTCTSLGGIMLTAMRAHGGYIHFASDFGRRITANGDCDKHGYIGDECPFYSGKTGNSAFQISAGAIHSVSKTFNVFEGLGYGCNSRYWQLSESEGGGYLKNSHYSFSGILAEVGVLANIGRVDLSVSLVTIEFSQWFGRIGIGINF